MGSKPACWKKRLSSAEVMALHQHRRNVGEADQPALLPVAVEQVGDELRLELKLAARGIVGQRHDLRDAVAGELDHARLVLVEVGIRAREDLHRVGAQVEIAHGVAARIGVAGAAQLRDHVGGRKRIAHPHRARRGENLGGLLEGARQQLLIDQPRVLDVVIRKDAPPAMTSTADETSSIRPTGPSRNRASRAFLGTRTFISLFFSRTFFILARPRPALTHTRARVEVQIDGINGQVHANHVANVDAQSLAGALYLHVLCLYGKFKTGRLFHHPGA